MAEVAALAEFRGYEVVVNVQGDEPFLPAEAILGAVREVERGADVGTAAVPLEASAAAPPGIVKVVLGEDGRALYFSRSVIPHARDAGVAVRYWQHLGVYAFRPAALARWMTLAPTAPELAEKLEQLRPLGHGMSIGVARLDRAGAAGDRYRGRRAARRGVSTHQGRLVAWPIATSPSSRRPSTCS